MERLPSEENFNTSSDIFKAVNELARHKGLHTSNESSSLAGGSVKQIESDDFRRTAEQSHKLSSPPNQDIDFYEQ